VPSLLLCLACFKRLCSLQVLIFSHSTRMMTILELWLTRRKGGYSVVRLDGTTPMVKPLLLYLLCPQHPALMQYALRSVDVHLLLLALARLCE
jgi:hypothetical protein